MTSSNLFFLCLSITILLFFLENIPTTNGLHHRRGFQSIIKNIKSTFRNIKSVQKNMVSLDWQQTPDSEDGMKYAHDEVTYRIRSGEVLHIPQAERYSSADWMHNLFTIPTSRLLERISNVVIFNFWWSVVVLGVHYMFKFPSPGSRCHSLLGSALGLLLVFRTNTAYNRFWEGRKIWEHILTRLRDLGRLVVMYADAMTTAQVERIIKLSCAFPIVLQEHIQQHVAPKLLAEFLTEDDIRGIDRVNNRPFFVLNKLGKEIRGIPDSAVFTSRERLAMIKHVDDLCSYIGACERIVQTPVPLTYARHTSRFLSLFCLSMPIALVGELGAYIIPFVSFVTWSLFGILEIGMMIEEPFQKALKLEVFGNTIRRDLSDLIHVTGVSIKPLHVTAEALGYEVPFSCRVDAVNKLLDEKVLTQEQYEQEVAKLNQRDLSRLRGNDPMQMGL